MPKPPNQSPSSAPRDTFAWMNATLFCGALNDNLFKMFVQMFLIGLFPARKDTLLATATVVFAIPFLLFTAYAGYLADRYRKNIIVTLLKYAEFGIMLLGLPAFFLAPAADSPLRLIGPVSLFSLFFLMSLQSALFSPTKYGIVPELVTPERLPKANSALVIYTYLAIILGTAAAPLLAKAVAPYCVGDRAIYGTVQILCVLIALIGIFTAHRIQKLTAANTSLKPDWLFPRQLWRTMRWVRDDYYLSFGLSCTFLFTLIASFLQICLVAYGIDHLGLSEEGASFRFFYAAVGIAFGAWLTGHLSHRNVEMGLLPVGSALLALSVIIVGCLPQGSSLFLVDPFIFLAGFGAGIFVVPLDTFLQFRLPATRRGEGFALNSFVSWLGVLGAGILMGIFSWLEIPAHSRLLLIGCVCGLLSALSTHKLRDFFAKFLSTLLVRCLYNIRITGIENLPVTGPVILVANHTCYFDELLIGTITRRRIRFLMEPEFLLRYPVLRFFGNLLRVIPIGPRSSAREFAAAIREAHKALADDSIVTVFPEGNPTPDGTLRPFHPSFERFARDIPATILPVAISGAWGTMYYYDGNRKLRHHWRRIFFRRFNVTLSIGEPLPLSAQEAHRAISVLLSNTPQ